MAIEFSTKDKLKQFFNLKEDDLSLRIYLSRHSATTLLPTIKNIKYDRASNRALKNIYHVQDEEDKIGAKSKRVDSGAFTVVSALEMIEAIRLKDAIERLDLVRWLSGNMQEELLKASIQVQLVVCPEPKEYKKILGNGTIIFIGGPRANLGTYYYLYGEEAGEMRPKRLSKNMIESISDPTNQLQCEYDYNLAIIQKHRINNNKTNLLSRNRSKWNSRCSRIYAKTLVRRAL
jgi:hypothetical protein